MRLFVYGLGLVMGVIFLSLNYVTTTNAVFEVTASNNSTCSFADIEIGDDVSAGAWQITELETGRVLADFAADKVLPFASITKLLTAQAVLEKVSFFTKATVLTYEDILTEGNSGDLAVGEEYSTRQLLFPLLLTSSNDAGVALASAYPDLLLDMQDFVKQAGALNTKLVDTTGLNPRNVTTAHDLSLLVQALYTQSPHLFDITKTAQVISRYDRGWLNNIPFRTLAGYQGGKQGYLPEAKQTGVAVFKPAGEESTAFIVSILFSTNVANDMEVIHRAVMQSYKCKSEVTA